MVQAWCKGGRRSILWSNSVQILPPPVGKTFILNFVQLFRISTLSRFSHGCQVFLLKLWQRSAGCYNQPIKSKVMNAIKIHFNDILYCDTPWLQIWAFWKWGFQQNGGNRAPGQPPPPAFMKYWNGNSAAGSVPGVPRYCVFGPFLESRIPATDSPLSTFDS